MNCEKYFEWMSAALDGELTAEERSQLDSHLAVCPQCAQWFQVLSANAKAARDLDCEVPADLKQRIMGSLPAQEKPAEPVKPKAGKVIHWKRWVPVAAAACLVLVISLVPSARNKSNSAPMAPAASSVPMEAESYSTTSVDGTAKPGSAPRESAEDTSYGSPSLSDVGSYADPGSPVPPSAPAPSSESSPIPSGEPESPREPSHYFFENQHSIRVSYGATPAPGARIIGSVESLEKYLAQFGSNAFDSEGNPVPNEKLESLRETYTEEFFRTRRLLCVVVESGSGSNRYEISSQGLSRDSVLISMYAPEIGTCDMAAWLLTAEVDTMFDDGDTLEVSITDSIRQTSVPIGAAVQEATISLRFENQRSIRLRHSWNMPETGAVIIGSVESLNEYLSQFKAYLGQELSDVSEDLQLLWNHYGYDQFFEGESLLMIRVDAPSGGDRLRIANGGLFRGSVILEQTADGATFDVGHWLIVAEVSANFFEDGDTLKVSIDKAYDRYCLIENIWFHRMDGSGSTSPEAAVIRSVEEMTEYLEANVYSADPVTGELIHNPKPEDLLSIYNNPVSERVFYYDQVLLAFQISTPVSDPSFEVFAVSSEAVTVRQDHYLFGNTTPSTWLILVQAYGSLDPDNPPKLVVEDGYP